MDKVLKEPRMGVFRGARVGSGKRGQLRGRGLATYIEV